MKLGMVGLGRMGGNMAKRLENDATSSSPTRSGGGTASSLEPSSASSSRAAPSGS